MTEQDCNQEYNSGLNTYHNLYIYIYIYIYMYIARCGNTYLVINVQNRFHIFGNITNMVMLYHSFIFNHE